jgi:hypothetical protein
MIIAQHRVRLSGRNAGNSYRKLARPGGALRERINKSPPGRRSDCTNPVALLQKGKEKERISCLHPKVLCLKIVTYRLLKFLCLTGIDSVFIEKARTIKAFWPWERLTAYELPLVRIIEHTKFAFAASGPSPPVHAAIPHALPQLRGALLREHLQRPQAPRSGEGASTRAPPQGRRPCPGRLTRKCDDECFPEEACSPAVAPPCNPHRQKPKPRPCRDFALPLIPIV